ncbi:asparagine synthase (glutamine-hydrolyzing) [Maribacter halichondriae]|uniref:asparagine synthase (glutamine-hydrolyzing) n=1 Tax=Maribacter halichondriae TaxID=2980554 RepID=UPI00235A0E09|nr:asparagine synthase (glutamine-hydrolyzing) [Maribacter sp. Hal144]
MCGIAGSINSTLTMADIDLIDHRGPDYKNLIQDKCAGHDLFFGHTRLSIIDLSEAGNQPMYTDCGDFCIVFNGEIYNHKELRTRLTHVKFRGQSDTETILYYLREFGIEGVKDFNGIFTFALLNKKVGKVFLARDFFGVKPLYYFTKDDKLVFSSEIKVIKKNPAYKKELDITALNTFLTLRYNPAPQTLFKDIKKLPAATYLEFDSTTNITLTNYWPKKQKVDHSISEKEAVSEYKRLLEQSVERQLLSDVPVGLLLSGGIDSAVLGYLMSQKSTNKINTFTVGFEGEGNFNELDDAKETARIIGSDHHEIFMNREEYMDYFYRSFHHTEEPIAEPTIPALYHVSNLASKHVKVVLSGQGADEPMAGYKRYRGEKFLTDYKKILSVMPLSLLSKAFPNNSSIDRGVYSSKFKEELDRFIAIYTLFVPDQKEKLYKNEINHLITESQRPLFQEHFDRTDPKADSLSKLLYLDTRTMLPDNLLLFNDKITMANSIENRVPFLDIDLINFIESLPIELKLKGKVTKYVHRKAAEQWLPASIINRKKRAFETPVGIWFKKELSESLIELIESPQSLSRDYFDISFIKKMVHMHVARKKDYKKHLFILLSLELWYKNFYNQN